MTFILTTPLYYVNDKPHLGSTYTTIACDALARFKRLEGQQVIFITGVDEHGQKIQRTAKLHKRSPQDHCNVISKYYQELWLQWGVTNDRFIRTTQTKHKGVVEQFFRRVEDRGDIYMGHQKGWYCVGCEEYKDTEPNDKTPNCTIHQRELEWRDEENLFFRLSKYQQDIENLVKRDGFIEPSSRKNEVINFVKGGLKDFSISRVNVSWGIPVPGYPGHTFYVWFDALLGYLTALLDDGLDNDLNRLNSIGWPSATHIIGKDILRFHAVYWPAMLISAGLNVPNGLYGHGFLTREGQKMGKSLGNILDPKELLESYGSERIRWYLLRDIQFGQDGDFQQKRFIELVNNDLSNTIGNMLNRSVSMSRKWFQNCTPLLVENSIPDDYLSEMCIKTISTVRDKLDTMKFNEACESILNLARNANIYLNDKSPWKMIKDVNQLNDVSTVIYNVLETSRIIGILLKPILPELSGKILKQLIYNDDFADWQEHLKWGRLEQNVHLQEPIPIIPKL